MVAVFADVQFVPDVVVESVDHHELAEDGCTLIVSCTTKDGRTLFASFAPGERMILSVQPDMTN